MSDDVRTKQAIARILTLPHEQHCRLSLPASQRSPAIMHEPQKFCTCSVPALREAADFLLRGLTAQMDVKLERVESGVRLSIYEKGSDVELCNGRELTSITMDDDVESMTRRFFKEDVKS